MTFFLFVIIIILLFWIGGINNRLHVVEKKILSQPPLAPLPAPIQPPHAAPLWPAVHGNLSVSDAVPRPPAPVLSKKEEDEQQTQSAANWFSKIGVLALLFGLAFFLKYAIDQGWISEWTRIAIGLAAGSLLVLLGYLWRDKYVKYAPVLSGGGIAMLYFSIYAAYQFYSLIPQPAALAIMVIITAVATTLAFKSKSMVLAVFGIAGAFLSPVLIASGKDQQTALFIYLLLLNTAGMIVLARQFWPELLFACFIGSIFDFSLWAGYFSNTGNTGASTAFVVIIFLMFMFGAVLLLLRARDKGVAKEADGRNIALFMALAGVFYLISTSVLLYNNFHSYLPLLMLLGGVAAFMAYVLVDRLEYKALNYLLSLNGATMLSLAVVWQYNGKTMDLLLLLLGLLGFIVGRQLKRAELRVWGLVIQYVAALLIIFVPYDARNYQFLFNEKFGLMVLAAAALLLSARMYRGLEQSAEEGNAENASIATAVLLLWFAVSWELVQYFGDTASVNTRNLSLSVWWIVYAAALMGISSAAHSRIVRKLAIGIFSISIVKVFAYDVLSLDQGYRIVSFIALGIILLAVSFAYQKNKEKISEFLDGERK